jgi:acid phosphatase type 7
VGESRVSADARTHPDNTRRRVNAMMARVLEANPEIVGMLHGADYTVRAYWSQLYYWLNDHAEMTTTSQNRLLPIIPARGNHDRDITFEEVFWWPNRQVDYYYTTRLGGLAAVITLNTNISRGGDQREWLESQLRELRPANRWLVVQYHAPAWPSVRDFAGAAPQREAWVPLFEQYHIDLGYEAHDHALKRTHPIFDNQIDEERGIVYIGDGGGGVPLRQPDATRWYLKVAERHFHTHLLRLSKDRMHVQAIDINNEVVDDFVLTHDRRNTSR